jgi:predicted PurR-regulated permease PerM
MPSRQYLPLQNVAFPFVAVAAATAFLYFASPIVIPLVVAASLAYVLAPAVSLLRKIKIPHAVAVVLVLIIAFFILGMVGYLLSVQVNNLVSDLPLYWNTVVEFSAKFLNEYKELFPQTEGLDTTSFKLEDFSGVTKYLFRGISSTISFLFSVLLVLFLTFFILNDQDMLKRKLIRAFSKSEERTGVEIMEKVSKQIQGFLLVKFGTSFVLAILLTLGLLIIGVNYAYVWGPLAGVLNLIPYVGPIIGAIPPLIVAAVQFKAWMPVIWVLILFLVFQNLEGNLITPKLMGDKLNLSPLAVLVSVMFWTWLWGAIGILLAIPITASAKVICDHVEALQPIGILLGGKGDR